MTDLSNFSTCHWPPEWVSQTFDPTPVHPWTNRAPLHSAHQCRCFRWYRNISPCPGAGIGTSMGWTSWEPRWGGRSEWGVGKKIKLWKEAFQMFACIGDGMERVHLWKKLQSRWIWGLQQQTQASAPAVTYAVWLGQLSEPSSFIYQKEDKEWIEQLISPSIPSRQHLTLLWLTKRFTRNSSMITEQSKGWTCNWGTTNA